MIFTKNVAWNENCVIAIGAQVVVQLLGAFYYILFAVIT
jgi:hypothetical protein